MTARHSWVVDFLIYVVVANNYGVDDHICTQFGKDRPPLHWLRVYDTKNIYNMNETSLFYRVQANKIQSTRKCSWAQKSWGLSYSCSCCKHNMQWEVETCDRLQICKLKMLWKVVGDRLCVVTCKPNGLDDIVCLWQFGWWTSMNISNLKSGRYFLIMDNPTTHSLKHITRGESFGFSILQLSNIIIDFIPPNVASAIQPLD